MSAAHSTGIPARGDFPSTDGSVEYRSIDRFPGYVFGSDGSVWSCWCGTAKRRQTSTWKRILGTVTKRGYREVAIRRAGASRRENFHVHPLILEAFVGPRPPGMEGCHGNGNPTDNRLGNLRWDTPTNNTADKFRHGTVLMGSRLHAAKLDEDKVVEIRRLRRLRVRAADLASRFGVDVRTINRIVACRIWKHV